jgi:hypothetical protein
LARNYSVIDDLPLSQAKKSELGLFVETKIEDYFHRKENELTKEEKLKIMILNLLIENNEI